MPQRWKIVEDFMRLPSSTAWLLFSEAFPELAGKCAGLSAKGGKSSPFWAFVVEELRKAPLTKMNALWEAMQRCEKAKTVHQTALLDSRLSRILALLDRTLEVEEEVLRRTKSLDRKYELALKVGVGLVSANQVETALERINKKARKGDVGEESGREAPGSPR